MPISPASSIHPWHIPPILKAFKIELPSEIQLESLYICIHDLEDHEKIKLEQFINNLGRTLLISVDTRIISKNNGFQIYGFQKDEEEPVVGLTGNSNYLNKVTALRLEKADDDKNFPTAF